jgi:hypothetical protein
MIAARHVWMLRRLAILIRFGWAILLSPTQEVFEVADEIFRVNL